ncbi:MAG: hypothetical protein B7Y51_03290 [Burkholderiales bacterium 28-67-8]|nr:MAG: hypothetical protein B7Y51_03290 [Burkholderiales bacterium 28-67-8]
MSSLKSVARMPVVLPCLVSLLAVLGGGSARGETNPYYIGASQTFTRESNVFKVPDQEHPKSDVISGTSIFGGVDQSIGRQRVYATASLQNNSYNRLSRLDFVGYDVMAGFDWATIKRLSGSLTYSRHEGQGDFSRPEAATITSGKFVETTEQIAASINYELITDLGLSGGVEHRKVNSSNQASTSSDVTSEVARLGLGYKLGGSVNVGTAFRFTRDKRPESVSSAGRTSTRRDLDLTTGWTPTALTSVNARVSVGNGNNSQSSRGSSSQVTGSLGARYSPTGRLSFNGSFSRDTGTETTFLNAANAAQTGLGGVNVDTNRVTESVNLGVTYLLTSKINLTANYSRSDGSYESVSGSNSDNTINRYALGGQYEVARNLSLGCGVQRESRSGTSLTVRSYSSNSANCSVRYTLK